MNITKQKAGNIYEKNDEKRNRNRSWLEDISEELQGNRAKISTESLSKHDSYIAALEEVISKWNESDTPESKTRYIKAIGDIGYKIYRQNNYFNI